MRIAGISIALLLLLGISIVMLTALQTQLLFPTNAVPSPGPLPASARPITVEAPGATLHGVHIPPSRPGSEKLLILGFGGNAWNGADVAAMLHDLFPQADAIAFHYRGYRPSTGEPSAEALLADAPFVLDEGQRLVSPERSVAVGLSIGSGVAAGLASTRRVDGLILVTPFDSLRAVAREMFPWVPAGLVAHEMDSAEALRKADVPVAVIAAERDDIISAARSQALRRSITELRFDRTIAGAGHNDLYGRGEFRGAMTQALQVLLDGEPPN